MSHSKYYNEGREYLSLETVDDDKKALEAFMRGAEAGDPECINKLGEIYEKGNRYVDHDNEKALSYYLKVAEEYGNPIAYFNLGLYYFSNNEEYEKAVEWLYKAYLLRYPAAVDQFRDCYKQSLDDQEEFPGMTYYVFDWMKGIKVNDKACMLEMAELYKNGAQFKHFEIEKDEEKAAELLSKAAPL